MAMIAAIKECPIILVITIIMIILMLMKMMLKIVISTGHVA